MTIKIILSELLKEKKITSKQLAKKINLTEGNLSILRSGKAKAIRISTLESICKELECQPSDIIIYMDDYK